MRSRWSLVVGMACFVAGCGPASKEAPITVSVPSSNPEPVKPIDTKATDAAATELLTAIRSGKLTADQLTVGFRKVIGEPLTPDEREKGYSDSAALEWLKIVSARLVNTNFKSVSVGSTVACYSLDSGTMRIIRGEKGWQIDWFHAGRMDSAAPLAGDESAKRFALATFLDPLFTGNYDLSESVLSEAVKASLAPPLGRDVGFNRGTLRGKLRNIHRSTNGYTTIWNGFVATVSFAGSDSRPITITVGEIAKSGVWHVTALELP